MGNENTPSVTPLKRIETKEDIPTCQWAVDNGECLLDEIREYQKEMTSGFTRLAKIVKTLHTKVEDLSKNLNAKMDEILAAISQKS